LPASQAVDIAALETRDFAELEAAWVASGWAADYRQTRAGKFSGRLLRAAAGAREVFHGTWAGAVEHRGVQPSETASLVVTLGEQGAGQFVG